MKFKEITEKDKEKIRKIYFDKEISWDNRIDALSKFFEKSERTTRRWLVKLKLKGKEIEESGDFIKAKKREFDKNKKRFIVTWAQNATPIHKNFFENIKAYAKFIDADIHVIAGRYKNPTSVFSDKDDDWWDKETIPYLDANRHNIHKNVSILSDVKIQPTAVNPMSGLQSITGQDSCIIGHPRVQLQTLPSLEGYIKKFMLTTGACTNKNYTDSKAGKKGEFHHTLGFVIIEIKDEDIFFPRQVTATNDGNFTDLFYKVQKGKISKVNQIESAILGDIHLGQTDEEVMKSTTKLLDKLKPKNTVIHDIFDGFSINHHEINDPIKQYKKEITNQNSLKNEIDYMIKWIDKMRKYNLVVARSNHDDFVDRWVINSDWKKHIKNSKEYLEYAHLLLTDEAFQGIIPYEINKNFNNVITLGRSDSFRVKEWELAQHGDVGCNGSRGTLEQLRKLNIKMVTAHSHTPGRKDGILSVGTSTKERLGYNEGPSNWAHAHVIIHEDGKAQHVIFFKNKKGKALYTTLK